MGPRNLGAGGDGVGGDGVTVAGVLCRRQNTHRVLRAWLEPIGQMGYCLQRGRVTPACGEWGAVVSQSVEWELGTVHG